MTVYSYAQLEALWINAGGPASVACIAAAIAEAESNGNSAANNYNDSNGKGGTQTSWGLWQISNGTHNMPVANINDPNVNAQQAVAKYRASGWAPWGTYTSGAYKSHLNCSTTPASNVPAGSGGGTGGFFGNLGNLGSSNPSSNPSTSPTTNPIVTTAATAPAQASGTCLISSPNFLGIGGGCFVSKSEGRAVIGGLVLLAGGLTLALGVAVIAAVGLGRSGVANVIPGPAGVATRAAAGGGGGGRRSSAVGSAARRYGAEQQRLEGPETPGQIAARGRRVAADASRSARANRPRPQPSTYTGRHRAT